LDNKKCIVLAYYDDVVVLGEDIKSLVEITEKILESAKLVGLEIKKG